MPSFDDDEPVFKRSPLGTNRYEYNPRNPVGLALIIITVVFVGVMLLLMHNHAGPFAYPSDPTPAPTSTEADDISHYLPPDPYENTDAPSPTG